MLVEDCLEVPSLRTATFVAHSQGIWEMSGLSPRSEQHAYCFFRLLQGVINYDWGYYIKQVTGVMSFIRTESVLHLNNQGIKKKNSYRFFVMINWTRTRNVWAIPLNASLSVNGSVQLFPVSQQGLIFLCTKLESYCRCFFSSGLDFSS